MRRSEFDEIKQDHDFYSQRNHEEACFKYYCLGYEKALDTKVYSRRNLEQQLSKAQADLELACETLNDFKDHGTRHDINPTGQFKPCGCFDSFHGDSWQSYIRSQDQSVRERAIEALKQIKEKKGDEN